MLKNIFSIQKEDNTHTTIRILGIRIRILNSALRKKRRAYQEMYSGNDIKKLPIVDNELREIQLANLGLLKCIDKLCRENDIQYWIDFGTLLGAVRHGGFIPWDDDIDIGMLREDYEKFINLFQVEIKAYPELYCDFLCNYRNQYFLKIKHKKTENLFVDIFPYDLYYKKLNKTEKDELSKLIHKLIQKKWWIFFKTEVQIKDYLKNITQTKILKNQYVNKDIKPAVFMGVDYPHSHANKVYDYEQIFPLKTIAFEDYEFSCPNNYHEVLESAYGDYMTIPKDVYPRHVNFMDLPAEEIEAIKSMGKI